MNNSFIKIMKIFLSSLFIIFFLASCTKVSTVIDGIARTSPTNHKNFTGSNNFHSLVQHLVEKSYSKFQKRISIDDVVLVSDFVNLDKLENRSKLGFLLSDHLKNALTNRNIIVREVELGREFEIGRHGFNILTRDQREISKTDTDSKYAMVGTYTITTESLIVFIKLINITNGNIISSASGDTLIDDEILELEGLKNRRNVLVPHMVL